MDSSVAKCFLVPIRWGPGAAAGAHRHDALQKSLVLSHNRDGPSARLVLWRNYLGFDENAPRTKLGEVFRTHSSKRQDSQVDEVENENQSFLGILLGKALSKYVSSQLEGCGDLEVHIAGSNQDIFKGQVKKVRISAKQAIYKGISLSDVDISASSIQLKLGKKRLLQDAVQVKALISIGEEDLKNSLGSPLISYYLEELLPRRFSTPKSLSEVEVGLHEGVLVLDLDKHGLRDRSSPVGLLLKIKDNGQSIQVSHVQEREQSGSYALEKIFNVGSETKIKELRVGDSRLVIQGNFLITP